LKSLTNKFFAFLFIAGLFFTSLSYMGCKDEDSGTTNPPATDTSVPKEIFPLVPGRVIEYNSGTLLSFDSSTPIAGSEIGYQSKWIIAGPTPYLPPYTSPTAIIDTTKTLGLTLLRTFLIHRDTTANIYYFLTNLGYFFRSQNIQDGTGSIRGDSLRWIALAKPGEGLKKKWIAFSESFTSATIGAVKLEITGEFEEKESLTAAGSTYTTYRTVATRNIFLGTSTTPVSTGITARLWMVENVGPIKIELRGDAESHGKLQTMTGKNFWFLINSGSCLRREFVIL